MYLTVEYSSTVKSDEPQTHAATWVDCTDTILSERSQTQKSTRCIRIHIREALE